MFDEAKHTINGSLNNIKISFFKYEYPLIKELHHYNLIALADIFDIALMKLIAISGRGSRKDFVDLYCILRSELSMDDLFKLLPEKYGAGRANTYHILKSLTYFEDAEKEPLPRMLEPFEWEECKNFFSREAHAIVLPP